MTWPRPTRPRRKWVSACATTSIAPLDRAAAPSDAAARSSDESAPASTAKTGPSNPSSRDQTDIGGWTKIIRSTAMVAAPAAATMAPHPHRDDRGRRRHRLLTVAHAEPQMPMGGTERIDRALLTELSRARTDAGIVESERRVPRAGDRPGDFRDDRQLHPAPMRMWADDQNRRHSRATVVKAIDGRVSMRDDHRALEILPSADHAAASPTRRIRSRCPTKFASRRLFLTCVARRVS